MNRHQIFTALVEENLAPPQQLQIEFYEEPVQTAKKFIVGTDTTVKGDAYQPAMLNYARSQTKT